MELSENGFSEEFLPLRRDTWETIPTEMDGLFSSDWSYGCYDQNPPPILPNSYCQPFSAPFEQDFNYDFSEVYCPFVDELSAPQLTDSSMNTLDTPTPPFPIQEDFPLAMMGDEEANNLLADDFQNLEMQSSSCKVEPIHESPEIPVFKMGTCPERMNRSKKVERQPSKNLMAERRRRKRLNDRLSMLRSIVPKISKVSKQSPLLVAQIN